ncbi:MAG TPA: WcbI family polysaccharide biosynthesis putative acetyltransferase [Acetobacteraceae bacterium]|nr:WcbI family polysaccharide biosynthesis putative acetyltransferase [Acetobacteraceae bacterium]
MRRLIVFVGNCQLDALAQLYQRLAAAPDDEVVYLASYRPAADAERDHVAEADILLRQVLDFAPRVGDVATRAETHLIPHIAAPFLWPCTGAPHPRNAPAPMLDASGPYPAELGDSFLDRLIAAGVPAGDAVAQYLDTDLAALRQAGRMAEIVLDRQRSRDRACGTGFAELIAARIGKERLFRSPNHPEPAMFAALAGEAFGRIGVASAVLEQLATSPPEGFFPTTETPIHPSIIAHFGLRYAGPETRYHYFNEGRFSFVEFADRYMRYEWNAALAEAFHLFWRGQDVAAISAFVAALPGAPRSAAGRFVLSELLGRQGRMTEALEPARAAAELEPENPHYRGRFEWLSSRLKDANAA